MIAEHTNDMLATELIGIQAAAASLFGGKEAHRAFSKLIDRLRS